MKRTIAMMLGLSLLLAACAPTDDEQPKQKQDDEQTNTSKKQTKVKDMATDQNVQGDNYRTILPFKESQARGLVQEEMANGYNGEDFEDGLLNISRDVFPTDSHLYQDGQYLNKDTIRAYLKPKFTKKEIDKMSDEEKEKLNANENLGLNPSVEGEKDPEKIAKNSPALLSNILEQDFYSTSDTQGKNIEGMTIGLAMNSVYYYQKEEYGETYSETLDTKMVKEKGQEMAEEMLSRLRENSDLKDIPITFAIYIQSGEEDIVPGQFVSYAVSEKKGAKLNEWKKLNTQTVLLPSSDAADLDEGLNSNFQDFNSSLQSYFNNFTQAVGKAKFVDKKVERLVVDLPIDYYGKAELIGITQYVTQLAEKDLKGVPTYEIHIKDGSEPRALITKNEEDSDPQVHIYNH
ncbi:MULTISPECIES: CamS family sex pheromone protein [unclassified Staphylococcus]|uniref:CamS family sex pheromone protein n=1 Tax=unclassified Staphylococcus TaxID=91994 RepID=UPI0021D1E5E8|nr:MULTISPECIES: CamS family sex pheromone protein [unclassified Staphylococcus]UXR69022.1 CamS family sex pheromone protein [Staphylococcus sp. IVB6246]UXR71072.1 CamS family sex pheromone protein [Staphylococcus sp. IVB6240]UXR73367.1 CamS family sex pheromone protein [Staphylococcus sp. IVB6238]UXR75662.1 CamS family sex pheromone protein [Staphylococcus sp. IVB6233]UXR79860.1 CamS family sex pheromone protein [Staphylococcus sp. IVB6218]